MRSLSDRVLRAIDRDALVPPGGRLLVALSGGADSMALAAILVEAANNGPLAVAGLVHVNHQLRGAASDGDEQFCREVAQALRVPITVERAAVAALARTDRVSIEDAGHRARYAIFDRVVTAQGADAIATGHTRDDVAETVLLRLVRGAGPGGLAGVRPRAGRVVRPLLDVSRQELRDYLSARGLSFREDETNRDVRMTRNRVRHRLLPLLAEEFSPAIVDVLARDAAIARADAEWIDAVANEAAADIVTYDEGWVRIAADRLHAQPTALARRIAKLALERASGRGVGFAHVERLLGLAATPSTPVTEADFPRCRVERQGTHLVLRRPPPRQRSAAATGFEYRLNVPGEIAIVEAGLAVSAEHAPTPARLRARGRTVAVAGAALTPPLTVRSWRSGDAFRPLGLGGRKKLQDLFVDRKIEQAKRGFIPIVADARGRIVWVVGQAVAEEVRVTDPTAGVLMLKARKLGGLG